MYISRHYEYLVTINNRGEGLQAITVMGDELAEIMINNRVIEIETLNDYEIYTKCPNTGATGYDIKLVRSTDKLIKKYPHYDCTITKNDCNTTEDFINPEDYFTTKQYFYNK